MPRDALKKSDNYTHLIIIAKTLYIRICLSRPVKRFPRELICSLFQLRKIQTGIIPMLSLKGLVIPHMHAIGVNCSNVV